MSTFSKERNGNFQGNPSRTEKAKGVKSDPFFKGSAKKSSGGPSMAKGLPTSEPESLPSDAGSGKGFKYLDRSEIKKGSI